MHVPRTDADTLTALLKDVLIHCNLSITLCRGQSYDGAANMSGWLHGVASQIKSVEPTVLYVHCLNLCLQDAARICAIIRDSLELVIELVKLIKLSQKRSTLF